MRRTRRLATPRGASWPAPPRRSPPSCGTSPPPARACCEALERRRALPGAGRRRDDVWPGELEAVKLPAQRRRAQHRRLRRLHARRWPRSGRSARARAAAPRARPAGPAAGRLRPPLRASASAPSPALDFEDLELITRRLLGDDGELRERYAARFERIMVDELQDTNRVQLELIESIARDNLFTVGDAQQSIYGFRHADVELFERRGERLGAVGARETLQTNFRSRAEILAALNLGVRGRARRRGSSRCAPVATGRRRSAPSRRRSSSCSSTRAPTGSRRAWRRRGGWPRPGRWPTGSPSWSPPAARPGRSSC